jgi:Fe-S cluster biosynthesis and repair protein YggX
MGQLMFATDLKDRCRQPLKIEGYNIPEWNLHSDVSGAPSQGIFIGSNLTRIGLLAKMIDHYKPRVIDYDGLIWRYDNLSDRHSYERLFPEQPAIGIAVPEDHLLIHIRVGDVATHTNKYYGPLPVMYYRYLLEKTKLKPIFIGELSESGYVDTLKKAFPDAQMIGGESAVEDFATLRRARNVAIAVSTFSWLATYLSRSAGRIHVPVAGHFDPLFMPDSDLLPTDDERYVFHRVSRRAWARRYEDQTGSIDDFSAADLNEIERLKLRAKMTTSIKSARVHFGLLRRLALAR